MGPDIVVNWGPWRYEDLRSMDFGEMELSESSVEEDEDDEVVKVEKLERLVREKVARSRGRPRKIVEKVLRQDLVKLWRKSEA